MVPISASAQPFRHLGKAFTDFIQGRAQRPRFEGKAPKHPTFKLSADLKQIGPGIVQLPVIGQVRAKKNARVSGRIVAAIVRQDADGWTLSVVVELPEQHRPSTGTGTVG